MDDQQIIELYWARSESAIAETDKKYGNLCTSYQYNTLSERIVKLYDLPDTNQWVEVRPGQEDRFITEAEAKQIMAQYPIVELNMKHLSEYPLP